MSALLSLFGNALGRSGVRAPHSSNSFEDPKMDSRTFARVAHSSAFSNGAKPDGQVGTAVQVIKNRNAEIVEAFKGQIYVTEELDVVDGKLYDCIEYAAGQPLTTANSQFFVNVEQGSCKTYAHTNMARCKKLDAPEAFSIARILLTFSRDTSDEDVFAIAENWCFQFFLGCKQYVSEVPITMQISNDIAAPIRICEYCRAVYVQAESCPGCGSRHFSISSVNGDNSVAGGRTFFLDLPGRLVIANQISFFGQFAGNTSYTCKGHVKLWCTLQGLHARGVC